jgi:hypothetical protein
MSEAQVALYTATGVTVYRVDQAGSEAEPTGAGFLKVQKYHLTDTSLLCIETNVMAKCLVSDYRVYQT